MSKRYTIKHEPSIVRSWFAIEDHHPRRTPPTGFEGYDKTDAQDVADMLNDRIDLLAALEELLTRSEAGLCRSSTLNGLANCDAMAKARAVIAKARGE